MEIAVVVDPSKFDHKEVRFGAKVVVQDEDGVRKSYTLVGPDESKPEVGALSFQSPIGRALMKKRVGDIVTVRRPAGEVDLEVIQVSYGESEHGLSEDRGEADE